MTMDYNLQLKESKLTNDQFTHNNYQDSFFNLRRFFFQLINESQPELSISNAYVRMSSVEQNLRERKRVCMCVCTRR